MRVKVEGGEGIRRDPKKSLERMKKDRETANRDSRLTRWTRLREEQTGLTGLTGWKTS